MRLLILLLLLSPTALALEWSEIMYDATGRDNGKEWIELIGNERLTGCTIQDSSSSDTLELIQEGKDGIILIVESDHTLDLPGSVWIYGAGNAIGNGLGNSGENLNITCNSTSLSTKYPGIAESGVSIVYDDGWSIGTINGTPGIIEEEETIEEDIRIEKDESSCNTTLAITLSRTKGMPGQHVLFTIVSDGFAGFMAESNGTIILEGDTLTRREYGFSLPEHDVKLSAYARQCDARQRAVRYIEVLEINNRTENMTGRPLHPVNDTGPTNVTSNERYRENETGNATPDTVSGNTSALKGDIVYDKDGNVVPWVSAFGMVTLVVSAGLFWKLRKEEI